MLRLYCNGKKDFCDYPLDHCSERCVFYDGSGSEYIEQEPKPAKVQTNADRIRSMSDEELAEFLNTVNVCDTRTSEECRINFCASCGACVLDWLRQPVDQKPPATKKQSPPPKSKARHPSTFTAWIRTTADCWRTTDH